MWLPWLAPRRCALLLTVSGLIACAWVQMPGLIPLRNPFHHSGAYPVPGNGSFDWQGYIPFDSLPRAHNPEEGFIASANNQVTPVEYVTRWWSLARRVA